MTIYIVEEGTWDHHENIAVFSSKEKAIVFCDKNYTPMPQDGERWKTHSYHYWIGEYELDANPM